MKHILLLLSAFLGGLINAELKAQTQVDILTKYNSMNPIVARWGLEVNQDWDKLLDIVLKSDAKMDEQNVKQAYNIILGAKIGKGQETATYIFDLYKIFKDKPEQLIKHSNRFFAGINQCLIYWLIPKTQFIEYEEFKDDMKKALARDTQNKMLVRFDKDAAQYFKMLKSGKDIPVLKKCNLYAIKKL